MTLAVDAFSWHELVSGMARALRYKGKQTSSPASAEIVPDATAKNVTHMALPSDAMLCGDLLLFGEISPC
ncbi:hypothetical protein [Roseateles sp.]|uniref:hypothetical protein n=1 Tax=Roseateles sp. TaxID=1971397 RepID=UPI003D0AA197